MYANELGQIISVNRRRVSIPSNKKLVQHHSNMIELN